MAVESYHKRPVDSGTWGQYIGTWENWSENDKNQYVDYTFRKKNYLNANQDAAWQFYKKTSRYSAERNAKLEADINKYYQKRLSQQIRRILATNRGRILADNFPKTLHTKRKKRDVWQKFQDFWDLDKHHTYHDSALHKVYKDLDRETIRKAISKANYYNRANDIQMPYRRRYRRRYKRRFYRKKRFFRRKRKVRSLRRSIKKRCIKAKRYLGKHMGTLALATPNYTRKVFSCWNVKWFTYGDEISSTTKMAMMTLTMDNFMSKDDYDAYKLRYKFIIPYCFIIQLRVVKTLNMVKQNTSSATNTLVTPLPSVSTEPHIYLYWSTDLTDAEMTTIAANERQLALLPGVKKLSAYGSKTRLQYTIPNYAKPHLQPFSFSLNDAASNLCSNVDTPQKMGKLHIIWPEPSGYPAGAKSAGGASIKVEIRGSFITDLSHSTLYNGQTT